MIEERTWSSPLQMRWCLLLVRVRFVWVIFCCEWTITISLSFFSFLILLCVFLVDIHDSNYPFGIFKLFLCCRIMIYISSSNINVLIIFVLITWLQQGIYLYVLLRSILNCSTVSVLFSLIIIVIKCTLSFRNTHNKMAKRKSTKGQTTIYKTVHRKLRIE
jgi:hypothetical protein